MLTIRCNSLNSYTVDGVTMDGVALYQTLLPLVGRDRAIQIRSEARAAACVPANAHAIEVAV